jgi:oxygen-independent coproporphyrinogen-3 oxidase
MSPSVAETARQTHAVEVEHRDPGFGIYVHWPFCLSKCPYCDFNSHVRADIDHGRWRRALLRELAHYAVRAGRRRVTSIFFGGGTPSLMHPDTVAAVIDAVAAHFEVDPGIEITLEANPTSAEAERFAAFRAAGVNRASLGVQALDDAALKFLGRQHSVAEALAAVDLARRSFPRYSFDLMTARPEQDIARLRGELERALAEGPEHISIYQLTVEPGTRFYTAWQRGERLTADDDTAAALYEETREVLDRAGLPAYEVSNHARPGAECRHNLTYWRYGDYVGIGPGAHGRLTVDGAKTATRQHRAPEAWLSAVEDAGHATRQDSPLSADERLTEMVMMGLRLHEGIARGAFRRELGMEPEALLDPDKLTALADAGYLRIDDMGIRTTPAGRLRLNALLGHLLG